MKKVENKIMLITYSDSLGKNLSELKEILDKHIKDAIGGIHILPFFPSSGDRGFAPMTYKKVDPAFGTWKDIEELSKKYFLMYDYMINHISAQSEYYQDFLGKKDESEYKDLFIRYKNFFENGGPSEEQVDMIYKRKPRAPYVMANFKDGTEEKVWCTFDEEQIDIHCDSQKGKEFAKENLEFLAKNGAAMIRLDAFAYATKKIDTNCFFVEPEVWNLLKECDEILK
ncbi:MAG: sucrose phosphorylase, partial [Clostridium paraputrificum]